MIGRVLLPQPCFLSAQRLQSPQEMHEVPGVIRLDHIGKRRHRRTIKTSHENAIEILIGLAALETRARREVVRADRIVLAVGERCRGGAIPMPGWAMTLPAFQLLEKLSSMEDAFDGHGRFCRNVD